MLNILTSEYKESLRADYRKRKRVVFLLLIFILLAIGFLLGFSLYVVSILKTSGAINTKEKVVSSTEIAEFKKLSQDLGNLNSNSLVILAPRPTPMSSLLGKIIMVKPVGIKIDSLAIDFLDGKKSPIGNIAGVSVDRQSLIDFVDALKKESVFTKVDFPVSNLISGNDNRFNVSLEISKKQDVKK